MKTPKKCGVLLSEQEKSQTSVHTIKQFSYIWVCITDGLEEHKHEARR